MLCLVLLVSSGKVNLVPLIPFWPEVDVTYFTYKHIVLLQCFNTHQIIQEGDYCED